MIKSLKACLDLKTKMLRFLSFQAFMESLLKTKKPSSTVRFNVGGLVLETERSVVEKYPASKLYALATQQAPVFLDANPLVFLAMLVRSR